MRFIDKNISVLCLVLQSYKVWPSRVLGEIYPEIAWSQLQTCKSLDHGAWRHIWDVLSIH